MHTEGKGRWLGLAMLSLGVAMIIVDATIVNVAVPSIIKELKLNSTTAEWVNTVYSLVFAALLVTVGRLGDVTGRRRMYLLGLVVFGGASILAGAAPTGELLIAARAGLENGVNYFVSVQGNTTEIVNATTRATNITSGTPFSLVSFTSAPPELSVVAAARSAGDFQKSPPFATETTAPVDMYVYTPLPSESGRYWRTFTMA